MYVCLKQQKTARSLLAAMNSKQRSSWTARVWMNTSYFWMMSSTSFSLICGEGGNISSCLGLQEETGSMQAHFVCSEPHVCCMPIVPRLSPFVNCLEGLSLVEVFWVCVPFKEAGEMRKVEVAKSSLGASPKNYKSTQLGCAKLLNTKMLAF